MPSGAQLNRWGNYGGIQLLRIETTATAVVLPGHGTTGVNDSGAYTGAVGLSKVLFQMISVPGFTPANPGDYEVTLLGTIDPAALRASVGTDPLPDGSVPDGSWDMLFEGSTQTGAGLTANPLTPGARVLLNTAPWVAYRAVLTAVAAAPAGPVRVLAFAIP